MLKCKDRECGYCAGQETQRWTLIAFHRWRELTTSNMPGLLYFCFTGRLQEEGYRPISAEVLGRQYCRTIIRERECQGSTVSCLHRKINHRSRTQNVFLVNSLYIVYFRSYERVRFCYWTALWMIHFLMHRKSFLILISENAWLTSVHIPVVKVTLICSVNAFSVSVQVISFLFTQILDTFKYYRDLYMTYK